MKKFYSVQPALFFFVLLSSLLLAACGSSGLVPSELDNRTLSTREQLLHTYVEAVSNRDLNTLHRLLLPDMQEAISAENLGQLYRDADYTLLANYAYLEVAEEDGTRQSYIYEPNGMTHFSYASGRIYYKNEQFSSFYATIYHDPSGELYLFSLDVYSAESPSRCHLDSIELDEFAPTHVCDVQIVATGETEYALSVDYALVDKGIPYENVCFVAQPYYSENTLPDRDLIHAAPYAGPYSAAVHGIAPCIPANNEVSGDKIYTTLAHTAKFADDTPVAPYDQVMIIAFGWADNGTGSTEADVLYTKVFGLPEMKN